MRQILNLLMILLMTSLPAMAEIKQPEAPLPIVDDSLICDDKDQSSAEALLKTIFACQNSQRSKEIIHLVFLGTDIHDDLIGITESDELLVPNPLQDSTISIKAWREKMLADFTKMDERALKHIRLQEVSEPSMHDQNPFRTGTGQTFEKALVRYSFTATDLHSEQTEAYLQTGRQLVIFMDGKAYLNQFPIDRF